MNELSIQIDLKYDTLKSITLSPCVCYEKRQDVMMTLIWRVPAIYEELINKKEKSYFTVMLYEENYRLELITKPRGFNPRRQKKKLQAFSQRVRDAGEGDPQLFAFRLYGCPYFYSIQTKSS